MTVYLQKDEWGWYTLCSRCARQPKATHEANSLMCGSCTVEWQEPVEESPDS